MVSRDSQKVQITLSIDFFFFLKTVLCKNFTPQALELCNDWINSVLEGVIKKTNLTIGKRLHQQCNREPAWSQALGEKDRGYILLAADDMPGDLRRVLRPGLGFLNSNQAMIISGLDPSRVES